MAKIVDFEWERQQKMIRDATIEHCSLEDTALFLIQSAEDEINEWRLGVERALDILREGGEIAQLRAAAELESIEERIYLVDEDE